MQVDLYCIIKYNLTFVVDRKDRKIALFLPVILGLMALAWVGPVETTQTPTVNPGDRPFISALTQAAVQTQTREAKSNAFATVASIALTAHVGLGPGILEAIQATANALPPASATSQP